MITARWQGTPVAIKFLSSSTDSSSATLFHRELEMMARLHHPHCVQFLGYVACPTMISGEHQIGIVMEMFERGSLDDYVNIKSDRCAKKLPFRIKRQFCHQMSLALTYLHNRKPSFLIHRDVKPSNWLITGSLQVKLGDFGLARLFEKVVGNYGAPQTQRPVKGRASRDSGLAMQAHVDGGGNGRASRDSMGFDRLKWNEGSGPATIEQTSNCGTARFMAPEVAVDNEDDTGSAQYSTAADIFSLAMCFYFVFERTLPGIDGCVRRDTHLGAIRQGRRPQFSSSTPTNVRWIIERAWSTSPKQRPTAVELHEWWRIADEPKKGLLSALSPGKRKSVRVG